MSNTRILIVAHAPLAQALLQCAQHVFPDCEQYVSILDVEPHAAPEQSLEQARHLIGSATGDATALLILTDLFGATPANIASQLALAPDEGIHAARVITGVNFPMLLRAITYRNEALGELVERAVSGGTNGVMALPGMSMQHQQSQPSHDSKQDHHHQ